MRSRERLLDTFPGRLFVKSLQFFYSSSELSPSAFTACMWPEDLIREATDAVASYLYSDKCLEVLHLDVNDPELQEFDCAGLTALSKLSTFGSPQIHQGPLTELRPPTICNREPLSALPGGAFWTSTPLTDDKDSWTISGENLRGKSPRWAIYFDEKRARVARIDSARDWIHLIEANTVAVDACKYPDWTAIGQHWDAVHLSAAGLLLAHPLISATPFTTSDGSGNAHSKAGRYPSVANWSAVSTAWLHKPPAAKVAVAGARI